MARHPLLLIVTLLLAFTGAARAQENDVPDADPPDRAARLAYLKGDVSLQPAGEEAWAPALLNRPLTTGDKLWTEDGARAEIQVGQSAIRLDGSTGFSFLELGDDDVQMRVTAGTLILDVRALEGREQIEIDTPNIALAILRPGSYRIEVSDAGDATTVKIGEGEAEANGPSTNTLIHSEQVVTFRGVDELVADWGKLGPPDDFDEWSMERERRGERVASSNTARYVSPDVTGYDDLDEYGTWSSEPEYGYVWTPTRVVVGWSPYRYGRWVWVSPWGWTWIDDSPWGYAPFHYGRWAHVRNRWCWVPGPRHVRAVYAPALVGWVGSRGTHISWVPLGPRDVYVPWRRFSRHYWERVNFANARTLDRGQIREAFERRFSNDNYRNRSVPDAVTSVPRGAFTGAQRVGDRRVRFNEREMAGHAAQGPDRALRPVRDSRLGGVVRANPRIPAAVAARQVIVKREPPAASTRYTRRPVERPAAWQSSPDRGTSVSPPTAGPRSEAHPGHRADRPSRRDGVANPPRADGASAAPAASDAGSLRDRIREARDARDRDARDRQQRVNDDAVRWQGRDDRPARVEPSENRDAQYPQYSQRPRRTQDAVREAVARQLEQQRERESARARDADRARTERRAEPPRGDFRQEQPRPYPRTERRAESRDQPARERSQPQPSRSERQSAPAPAPRSPRSDDGNRDRHPRR